MHMKVFNTLIKLFSAVGLVILVACADPIDKSGDAQKRALQFDHSKLVQQSFV
jgi:signal recognition particle receptor subunit beta